jgi:Flp pilus assembly protein TadG
MKVKHLVRNDQGMVAITTTLVIMVLITLIVSSFTLVVRREQRQSLDKQLSTQAFYAAESGIQAAINAIDRKVVDTDITECTGPNSFFEQTDSDGQVTDVANQGNVSYSCVLIDRTLATLNYGSIDPVDGTYLIPIKPETNINTIKISWQNREAPDNQFATGSLGDFPQNPNAALPTGMPRVTLMRADATGRQDLIDKTKTAFLYPNTTGADSVNINSAGSDGSIVSGRCDASKTNGDLFCSSELTGVASGNNEYYLAVRALYHPIKMQITAYNGVNEVALTDAQTEIDVTGRAADVLRRVQVRYSRGGGSDGFTPARLVPGAALETTKGICKKFEVGSSTFKNLCLDNSTIDLDDPTDPDTDTEPPVDPDIDQDVDIGVGDAEIGNASCFPPGNPNCNSGSNGGDPNAPDFDFSVSLPNNSQNPVSVIAGCTWNWGDGSQPQNLPASQCEYGDWTGHSFPDTRNQIISSNAQQGCRIYTVTLTMRFNNGMKNEFDDQKMYIPQGKANDNPTGICYGHFKTYTP